MKSLRFAVAGLVLGAAAIAGCSQNTLSPLPQSGGAAPSFARATPQRAAISASHGRVTFSEGAFPTLQRALRSNTTNGYLFFAKIDGVTGPVQTAGFKGWMAVPSFSITPNASAEELTFPTAVNASTPQLLQLFYVPNPAQFGHVSELAVAVTLKSTVTTMMTFTFGSATAAPFSLKSLETTWTSGSGVPTETVDLDASDYTFCVSPINYVTGGVGSPVCQSAGPTPKPSPTPSPTPTPVPTPSITEFSLPTASSLPYTISAGFDGALWFTENQANNVGRITSTGKITEYPVTTGHAGPNGIVKGPSADGDQWFTESAGNQIGRIATNGNVTNEYPVPTSASNPSGIALGPDGNVWFVEGNGNKVGVVTSAGLFTEYTIPTSASSPIGIVAGPDSNLWFTESATAKIGRITTSGTITEFALASGAGPQAIVAGPDGALWFAESGTGKIGRITTAGTVTNQYLLPGSGSPIGIANGYDGALWFTDAGNNAIGRITTSGTIAEYPIPTANSLPFSIVEGPNSSMWFVERSGNKIGEIGPVTPSAARPRTRKRY